VGEIDKLAEVDYFFANKVWFLDFGDPVRLVGLNLKMQPGSVFCILKGITAEGPVVAFYGKESLEKLWRGLSDKNARLSLPWRADKFAFDKK